MQCNVAQRNVECTALFCTYLWLRVCLLDCLLALTCVSERSTADEGAQMKRTIYPHVRSVAKSTPEIIILQRRPFRFLFKTEIVGLGKEGSL